MSGVITMTGYKEFVDLFGNVTILHVVEVIFAGLFLYFCYKKLREHFIKTHEAEAMRDKQLAEALAAVGKYPQYRQQSLEIQEKLENEIQESRASQIEAQKKTDEAISGIVERLERMEELSQRRERNKLRDTLIQSYRYYTNQDLNPSRSWTRMEAEAFWDLFHDYEDAGGDGYMHTHVQPAMEQLVIIEMTKI